jgi:hypothetical protein
MAEADAEVERRFGQRLTRSLATRAPPGGAGGAKERN